MRRHPACRRGAGREAPGLGPRVPQRGRARLRHAHLRPQQYLELCSFEENLAQAIRVEAALHPKVVAIVPNALIAHDSLPLRLKLDACATVSVGSETGFPGEYVLVRRSGSPV
jgi:hypothetical protein